MNKNCYRIVFNAKRGLRMAVAETATAQGKSAAGETRGGLMGCLAGSLFAALCPISLAINAALGMVLWTQLPAQAQIVADPSAPANQRPTVLQTANGLPQVNIQTPSAAGVSRNTYSQFDIQRNGAVLNNSRTNVQTQTGGWVQGNPWLATGSARVILNEVNSSNPSQLKGYVEVAGQRAEVIIANPAGINVDGGGFINASGVTLTTGTPVMNAGSLDGYRVQAGSISINGQGLDTSTADYTGILARAVQVNAGIWAKELKVVTGANQIDAAQTSVTSIAGTGATPVFALDVAQLGGMYANKIHLIGTEAGVGVRNSGVIGAAAGDVVLQTNGWLSSSGQITAQGNASLSGTQVNLVSGKISAQNISLNASAGDVDATLATLGAQGTLSAHAAQTLRTDAAAVSANQLQLAAHDLSNVGGEIRQTGAGDTAIELAGNLNNTSGRIAVNSQNLTLSADTLTNTNGKIEHAGTGVLTLNANTLTNQSGQITGNGDLSAIATQAIDNSQGLLAANGDVALSAASLNNNRGTLASVQGNLNATTTGRTVNNSGNIQAALDVTLNNAGLSNTLATVATTAGRITGRKLVINTHGQNLDNILGTIAASQSATLQTGALDNAQGIIGATGVLTATAAQVNNTAGGKIASESDLNVTSTDFDNRGGQVQALDNVSLDAGAGTIDNTASLIRSAQTVTLTAATVTNSNTQGTNQGIEGNNIAITAAVIANDSGAIRADNNITLTNSGTLNNRTGLISATKVLTVQDLAASRALAVTNTGGTLIAGQSAAVQAASLSGDGKVLSKGDLSISLTTDFANTSSGEVIANGSSTLSTTGSFTNSGKFEAGETLTVRAADITNTSTLVGASVTLQASQRVRNRGPQAFIGASASTGLLQILAPEIINRDDVTATDTTAQTSIVGLGTVVLAGGIDGAGNYTAANTVRNESGYISSGADMSIHADTLTNTRRVLQTSDTYTPTGQTVQGQVVWTPSTPDVPGGRYIEPPHGGYMNSDYLYTDYQGTVARNSITQISPKAVIEAGGNLNPVVTRLQNYWSAVTAAGNIALNGVTLDQDGWQNGNSANPGVAITPYGESVTYSGTYLYRTYRSTYWTNSWGPTSPVVTPLGGFDASLSAGGAISGSGNTLINTSGVNTNTPLGAQSGLPQSMGTVAIPALTSLLPRFSLPTGGLFHQNPDPASRFLIETNPAFSNNKQWLSSNYYFEQLGLDPTVTQKRLGDGYYEQQLIKEQLIGLTGRAVLDYPDAQSQYQALMQAGAQYARELKLAPGIALSAAQVAQLSSDVVILQEAQVNGQVVLVPVVYLAAHGASTLLPTGSLIAANNIDLSNSQSITNSGTIRAQQGLSLDALSIDSRGGKLQSGGLMQLTSQNDIDLTSATLKAGSLKLDAGKNILLNTDAHQVTSTVQGGSRVSTQLGQIASIDVQGDARITTGANLEQNAGNITIGGNLQTNIGGNWTLGAVQSTEKTQATRSGSVSGHSNTEVVQQHTSSLSVGGQSNLQVANNFTAQGAAITLQGPATLQAGGDITLSAVKDSVSVDSSAASSSGSHNHSDKLQSLDETLRGTTLQAGQNLQLQSGQNITLSASNVNVSQGSATLQAAGSVRIETDTERHQSDIQHAGSHSGLLSSTTSTERQTSERTDNIGSAINATTVTVVAGKDLTVSGSRISSQTASTLAAGNNLIITAAQNSANQSYDKQETETGLMVSLDRIDLQVEKNHAGQSSQITQVGSGISSRGNTTILAGNQLGVYASDLSAGNTLTLQGTDVTLLGGLNAESASQQESTKHTGGFTVYHDPGKGINAHEAGTQDQANTTLVATTLSGQNINIKASGNQGDNGSITLAGVQASTPGSLSLDAGNNGTLNLNNASTESSQANSHTTSDLVYQKMQGQGSQQESGHANLLNVGQLNINAAKVNVPLAQSLQQLTQQPGMDYLNQLLHDPQLQGKVNWSAVELAHQHWDYEQQGLTQAGAVIVAIVVAYFTLGAASGVGVTAAEGAGFATTTTAAGTTVMATTAGSVVAGATTAAVTTLATQASISLINNQGDLGKTLNDLGSSDNVKGLVTAMLTGGALAGLNFSPTGQPTVNGGAQTFSSQLGKNLQAGVARSLISTAINGGSLEDSLKTAIASAFLDTAAAQGAFAIGELKDAGTLDAFTHKLAHALAGCAAGAARAGSGEGCAAGAIGAAVGEMAAEAYGKRADTVEFAAMISGIAAAVAGGDASQINLASQAGANAAANNYLKHPERVALINAQKACFVDATSPSCGTVTALNLKDQLSDKLLSNAAASCKGSECNDVTNFILQQMSSLGCTGPSACPDYNTLTSYLKVTQEKAQGIERVYIESWALDAKAVFDLGKFGVKLLSGASSGAKGSLDALGQLGRTDVTLLANNSSTELPNAFVNQVGGKPLGTPTGIFDMATNPGPLANMLGTPAANFSGGKYTSIVLTEDTVIYRAGSKNGSPLGQWYTSVQPTSVAQVRIDTAVKPQWLDNESGVLLGTSPVDTVYAIKVPAGTTIYQGPVASQGGIYVGGAGSAQTQIFIPKTAPGLKLFGVTSLL